MAGTRSSGFENINGAGSGAVGSFGFFDFCEFVRVSFFLFFFLRRGSLRKRRMRWTD